MICCFCRPMCLFSSLLSDGLLAEAQSAHRHAGQEEQGEARARGERRRTPVGAGGRSAAQLLQQLLEQEQEQEEKDRGERAASSSSRRDETSSEVELVPNQIAAVFTLTCVLGLISFSWFMHTLQQHPSIRMFSF